jgi:hypothetical protein
MPEHYITVSDETDCIRVDLLTTEIDEETNGIHQDSEEIAVIRVTPYLTGMEARRVAESVAGYASVNLSDDKPIGWGTNY